MKRISFKKRPTACSASTTLQTSMLISAGLILILFGSASFLRNEVWKDPVVLWTDVVSKTPGKGRDHYNLGSALALAKDYQGAERELLKSLELNPTYFSHSNLASVYYVQNRLEEAEAHYLLALRYNPSHPQLHYNLGVLYRETGRMHEARREFKKTTELDPGYEDAYSALKVMEQ